MNQYETQVLIQQFSAYGYDIVDSSDAADVYIINSCTVTASGDKKTRQMIHRMKRNSPGAVVALTGCFPQAFPEEAQKMEEVDILVGSGGKEKGAGICKSVPQRRKTHCQNYPAHQGRTLRRNESRQLFGENQSVCQNSGWM